MFVLFLVLFHSNVHFKSIFFFFGRFFSLWQLISIPNCNQCTWNSILIWRKMIFLWILFKKWFFYEFGWMFIRVKVVICQHGNQFVVHLSCWICDEHTHTVHSNLPNWIRRKILCGFGIYRAHNIDNNKSSAADKNTKFVDTHRA